MCGLIGCSGNTVLPLDSISHRGPDSRGQINTPGWSLGHTRLAIQDLSTAATQPWQTGSVTVTYNGELWNVDELRSKYPQPWKTSSDTEVIAHILDVHGVDGLRSFRGMFAIAWVDNTDSLRLARDPYGEIPLHYGTSDGQLMWCSEIKPLLDAGVTPDTIRWVAPGTVVTLTPGAEPVTETWFEPPPASPISQVEQLLTEGVHDRQIGDVPVALLLSGGLDSSLIASLSTLPHRRAYTAVHDPRSRDLKAARIVARRLGLELVEVPVPSPTRDDLARIVATIEMPHKAQVEIGWACDVLAQRIAADGYKVVISGEGADELIGSYGMAYHGIKQKGWRGYREASFVGQHRKNFPRVNKIFMQHSIEARLPFLHPPLVSTLLAASEQQVRNVNGRNHPKAILAAIAEPRIGSDIAWRTKAAFQTEARLDKTIAATINNPAEHYKHAYQTSLKGVRP